MSFFLVLTTPKREDWWILPELKKMAHNSFSCGLYTYGKLKNWGGGE